MIKPWYRSKTVWFNVLSIAVLIANQFGYVDFKVDPVLEGGVISLVNLVLRFITRAAIR